MRKLLALLLLLPLLAHAGTVTGNIQTASSGAVVNGTLTFTLNQFAVVSGTAQVVATGVQCYTSTAGAITGEPDPQTAPVLSVNLGSGTLAAGTYFVKYTYFDGTGESLPSPEASVTLVSQGTVIVAVPAIQPTNATGWRVSISAATGTETRQSSQTGFAASYQQTAALSAGTALPGSNTSACSIRFTDEMIPSTTYYTINLVNAGGSKIAGYPISQARFYGGTNGSVSVSSGWPVSIGGVIWPSPIVSTPNSGAKQSIAGGLDITGNVSVGGTLGAKAINSTDTVTGISGCIENGMYVAGSSCYATIAAARTAAGSNTVLIPSTYAGVDAVADGNNPVVDLRNNVFKASHFFGCAYPMTNAPGGLDCVLESNGAGDLYLSHNTHVAAATTTAVTLNVGANTNFLVGSTANFGTGGTAPIIVGRDTANEETVGTGNWSIVDGTHLSITCAKSHGPGTTDIEQLGVTHLDPGLVFQPVLHKPSQFSAATFPPIRWNDANGSPSWYAPGINSGAFPYGAFLYGADISGFTPGLGAAYLTPGDLNFRNASASNCANFFNSGRTAALWKICDTFEQFNQPIVDATAGGTPAQSGAIRFLNAHGFSWRNAANSADLSFGVGADDGLHFNTAAVVGTIPYNVGVANLTAQSASVGPTTIRAVAANQAGMFRVSWSAVVTTAATTSSTLGGATTGFQVTYTDNDTGAAVTTPLAAAPAAGTNTAYSQTNSQNTVGAQASGVVIVNAKASTNIQYNFGYTSVGATAMQYALHIRIEPI